MPRRDPLQCKRFQRFGRKQRYCGYAPRCVACGDSHLSGECSPHSSSSSAAVAEETTRPPTGAVRSGKRRKRCLLNGRRSAAIKGVAHLALPPSRQSGRSRPQSRSWDPAGTTLSVEAALSSRLWSNGSNYIYKIKSIPRP